MSGVGAKPGINPELASLLRELERRLRAFGAPIVYAFRPGAPPDAVRDAFAAEAHRAHADAVAWWGWHDGVTLVDTPPVESGPGVALRAENTLVEDWHVLSLADAVRTHRWVREDYEAAGASDLFPHGWFPILTTGAKPTMWIDCSAADDEPAPLYVDEHLPKPEGPLFGGLGDFVEKIIRAFDEGLVLRSHPEDPRVPVFDAPALPHELRRLSYW
jgi:hypothetical protein